MEHKNDAAELRHRIFTIVGIVLCVILVPILIVNCTLLVKGWINEDEVPSFGGYIPLIVLTGSMEDDFPGGSVIVSRVVDPDEIKEGDIISYFDPASKTGAVVTHMVRFIKTDEKGELIFYTFGTHNVKKPFEEVTEKDCEKIPAGHLVGRYTGFHIKGMGSAAMFMQSTTGLIVCVFVPLVALVAYDIIRRRLYEKQHGNDKEELLRELEELRRMKAAAEVGVRNEELGVRSEEATPAAELGVRNEELGVRSEEVGVEETNTDTASDSDANDSDVK